jgi:hypothetical protein
VIDFMITALYWIVYSSFLILMIRVVWESSKAVDEKKQRRHKGLTDYYDNPNE